ncbi:MAG: helicase-exonuclease AddAB subunit AddA [Sedimentisphaerales bacterium]|nr:helicase-exonuclease AddAB subunit AddA [Sedimentisphaerales bacterium]
MAEKKILWTDQQKQAITARGSDVLVTASAGTGKTAVLSGRCVDIISGKSDVRNFLVLTFTDAAAEQMRLRIARRLREAFLQRQDNHLRRQLILLQGADISTIHAFCKRLITEFFYRLDIDPTFGIIDGDEQRLLKAEVLEETIDWAWRQENLRDDLERLLYRRSLRTNDGFLSRIIRLSDFLDGLVSRDNWCERAAQLAGIADFQTTSLGEKQKLIIANKLSDILARIRYALSLYEKESGGGKWAQKWKENFAEPIAQYIELIESGDWDKFTKEINKYQKPSRYEYKPRGISEVPADIIRDITKKAKESFDSLFELAILNPDYLDAVGGSAGLQTKVLIELLRRFDIFYSRAKRAINCMDFADLEHYALRLLTDENSPLDEAEPSQTALMLRQRYEHIFVDEYQDINSVQQRILRMLSPGGNILHVGDVKQSIYAFRGAEPDIFLEQLQSASSGRQKNAGGLRVDLNANFRSVKGILDFVNRIFSRIMTKSFAGIDYDKSARLIPAQKQKQEVPANSGKKNVVEFHILDETNKDPQEQDEQVDESSGDDETDVVTSRRRQAAMIAQRIRRMVGADTGRAEFQIFDRQADCDRDVEYRDIVILMRSLAKKANDYVEVLRLAGVPVSCQATAGYFQATEISDCLALLKVLDNPQRDIEMAAVLRSSFFKVSDSELAKIKIHGKKQPRHVNFYSCVLEYSKSGPDKELADKLRQILAQIERWRTIARRGNLADLIWQIYRQTGFLSFVTALPNGQARKANLLKLHDRAIQFEGFSGGAGIPSLTRFVDFFEKLQDTGQDWAPAEPSASAGNTVRILSVHKSKGLEFPVVFLAEMESLFNKQDVQADCLVNAEDTLGLQIIDSRSNSRLSTLAHQVIAEDKLSKSLAEEMRILYVATTRAAERLVLTATQKRTNCRSIISNGLLFGDEPVPDWQLKSCRNPLEWILLGLSDQKILHEAFETGLSGAVGEDLFDFRLYGPADLKQLSEFVIACKAGKLLRGISAAKTTASKQQGKKLLEKLKDSLNRRYAFGDLPDLPAKTSVTALTHRNDEYLKLDYSRTLDSRPRVLMAVESGTIEPRLVGTAAHLVISRLDLTGPVDEEKVTQTIEKLLSEKAITAAAVERINAGSIVEFFNGDIGRLIFNTGNKVLREWPFTFTIPVCESNRVAASEQSEVDGPSTLIQTVAATQAETIIVQGIIDLLIHTQKGLVVVDFKTDKITAAEAAKRAGLYRRQLELYGRAASAVLKTKTLAKWLYFLTPGVLVEA